MLTLLSRATLTLFAIATLIALPAAAQSPPQITGPIAEWNRATLPGNVRPEANQANDRGRVADQLPLPHLMLQLQRTPQQEQAAASYVASLYDPSSPNYHKWLTAAAYGTKFGANPADIAQITSWLTNHGFVVNQVYPNKMLIDFSGTAGDVRITFGTEIHNLDVNGAAHIANMTDIQIPAALAPVVAGIVSLHDFMPHQAVHPPTAYTFSSGGYTEYTMVPGDLATIYQFSPTFAAGISGQGQTIVVIEDSNVYSTADWTTFRNTFGLNTYTNGSFTQVHPGSNCKNPGDVVGNDFEAILDAEWSSAAAPNAAIELASCADTTTTFGGLIALQNLISSSNPPKIFSISYGECEAYNGAASNASYNTAYQQAAAEGISVFVAAGDWGAAVCDAGGSETVATHGIGVNAFASTPYNVAVGGTDFEDTYLGENSTYWSSTNANTYTSAKSYVPEIPWNDSCASALIAYYVTGSSVTYGSSGFCNSSTGREFLSIVAGSGGPSACASGTPAKSGVVGGSCQGYAKPAWQSVPGNPSDGVRDLPDVALFAANGVWGHYYITCYSNRRGGGSSCTGKPSGWTGAGGTSFAAPIMAGVQALVNQKTGAAQGLPTPVYYALAAAAYSASTTKCLSSNGPGTPSAGCVFNNIAVGDMDVNCTGKNNCYLPSSTEGVLSISDSSFAPAYSTAVGWSFATGLGSVNVTNLVNGWTSVTPLAVSSK